MTASLPMPWHRTFVLLVALALALGALVPAFSPPPTRAISSSVVISQVYGGGGNSGALYTHDFIELFNLGAVAVDVSTWSVQYASSTGISWQQTNLTGSIAPGGYYLIQEAQGTGGTTALPTPDATGTTAMGGDRRQGRPRQQSDAAHRLWGAAHVVPAERLDRRFRGLRQRGHGVRDGSDGDVEQHDIGDAKRPVRRYGQQLHRLLRRGSEPRETARL